MPERLCACCWRNVPIDENEYVYPESRYGAGICELCKTFAPNLRQSIWWVKNNINVFWLIKHKADICKALFAPIGEREGSQVAADECADRLIAEIRQVGGIEAWVKQRKGSQAQPEGTNEE